MPKSVGPIRPFISSTFRDFQEERSHLNSVIFPQLNSLCYSIGTYFAPVELRWGVTESQALSGQVISLCLDGIDRCEPYFICLLGDRYGSHRPMTRPCLPSSYSDLQEDADWLDVSFLNAADGGHEWVLENEYQNLSVTELEIRKAAFRKRFKYCRFYFREGRHKVLKVQQEQSEFKLDSHTFLVPATAEIENFEDPGEEESEECKRRLSNLKQQILAQGLPVKYFCTAEELGRHILDDWSAIIRGLQPRIEQLTSGAGGDYCDEEMAQDTYADTRRRVFIETKNIKILLEKLDQHAMSPMDERKQPSIFTIVGESGCGKSAIIANWVKTLKKNHPNTKVIAHFVGSSAASTDINSLLKRVIYELGGEHAESTSDDHHDPDSMATFRILCSEFETAIVNYKGRFILVVDGIDEFAPLSGNSIEQGQDCPWIPDHIPKHCRFILSTNASDKRLRDRKDIIIESATNCINNRKDKRNVIKGLLAAHSKKLDPIQIDKVVEAKLSHLPLYLSVVANELRVVATFENLNQYLDEYAGERTLETLWTRVIKRWINDYGRTDGSPEDVRQQLGVNWVSDMLRLIACSRQGLTDTELREILNGMVRYSSPINVFDLARLRSATFDALFERRGGLLNFFQHHLRKAVHTYLLGQSGIKNTCHRLLATYFSNTDPTFRRTNELAYQYEKSGDMLKLLKEITDPRLFNMCSENQRETLRLDLVRYWHCIVKNGDFGDEWIATAYVEMVNAAKRMGTSQNKQTLGVMDSTSRPSIELQEIIETRQSSLKVDEAERRATLQEVVSAMMKATTLLPPTSLGPTPNVIPPQYNDYIRPTINATPLESVYNIEKELVLEPPCTATYRYPEGALFSSSMLSSIEANTEMVTEEHVIATNRNGEQSQPQKLDLDKSGTWRNSGLFQIASSTQPDQEKQEILQQREGPFEFARLQMETGKLLIEKACFTQAKEMFTNAVKELKKVNVKGYNLSLLVQLQESLADLFYYQLEEESAFRYYEEGLTTLKKIPVIRKSANYQQLMITKGRILNRLGLLFGLSTTKYGSIKKGLQKLQEAEICMNEANSRAGKVTTKFNIGRLKIRAKDFETGERYLRDALRERERWNGRHHPLVAEVLHELAIRLKFKLKRIEVKTLLERALDIRSRIFGNSHLLVATSLYQLGIHLKDSGNQEERDESKTLLTRALHIRESKLGTQHELSKRIRRFISKSQSSFEYSPTTTRRFMMHTSQSPSARHRRFSRTNSPHSSQSPSARNRRFSRTNSPHSSRSPGERQRNPRIESPQSSRGDSRGFYKDDLQHTSRYDSPTDKRQYRPTESKNGHRQFPMNEPQHGSRGRTFGHRFEYPKRTHAHVSSSPSARNPSKDGNRTHAVERRFRTPDSSEGRVQNTTVQSRSSRHSPVNGRQSKSASQSPSPHVKNNFNTRDSNHASKLQHSKTNMFTGLGDECDDDNSDSMNSNQLSNSSKDSASSAKTHKKKPNSKTKSRNKIKLRDHSTPKQPLNKDTGVSRSGIMKVSICTGFVILFTVAVFFISVYLSD